MHFEFGDFQLDPSVRELRRGDASVPIEPKVLDLLFELVRERGRVVSREALERSLWPMMHVSSSALSRLVKEARRALGDDGRRQTWIETRRGRGFRFASDVRERGTSLGDLPYVGREPLMRRLDAVLEAAFRGRGHLVLLSGEPGIGKTRTAEELAARARLLGTRVATAWSPESPGAPGLWSWIQLLRALVETTTEDVLRLRLGPSAGALADLLPELRTYPAKVVKPIVGAADRFRLFDAVRGFLLRTARDAPLVMTLDDLQWSDSESIELLDFLSHDLAETPLVILATYREPELARERRRAEAVARLCTRPSVERWPLEAFSTDEVRAFLEACIMPAPPPSLIELLSARSDGSPLFLGEILRTAERKGLLERETAAWDALAPSGVERFIDARVRGLSAETRCALSCAAAIGREFEAALLIRASGLPEVALRDALDEGESARVLTCVVNKPGWHRFTHSLMREALYAELEVSARAIVHAQIAEVLERSSGSSGREPEALAHHFAEAIPVLGTDRAIEACTRAGEHALQTHSYDIAVQQLERALDFLEGSPADRTARRGELFEMLGGARRRLGDNEGAREAYRRAAELAEANSDGVAAAQATLGFAGLYSYGTPDPEIVKRLERAADALGPEHEALRARLLGRLASELMLDADRRRRSELRSRAWVAAGNGGDLTALVEIAAHPDHGIWDTLVPPRERLWRAEGYVVRCAEQGLRLFELAAQVIVLDEFVRRGQIDDYDARADAVDQLGEEIREPRLLWARLLQRFSREFVRGDLEAAEARANTARDFAQRHLDPLAALALWGRQLAVLRSAQGRLGELREPWERTGVGAGTASNRALHAWICAAGGDSEQARAVAEPLWVDGAVMLANEPMAAANAAVLAEVCVFLEECEPIESLLSLLAPHAGMNAVRTYAACHGPVDHFRGVLESLRGRTQIAASHHHAALELAEKMGAPGFAARSHAALGRLVA